MAIAAGVGRDTFAGLVGLSAAFIGSGVLAGVSGLVLVFIFVMLYYRLAGIVAFIGLLVNIVVLFGLMGMFHFVLTLPGIAIHAREPEDDGTSRRFRWDLVPSRPGTVPIILPGLPYFDPTTKSYTRTAPAQVTMEVLPGHATVLAVVGRRPETLATVADAPATVLLLPLGAIAPIPGTTAQLVSGLVAAVLVLVGATHGRWRLRPSRRHRGQTLAAAARAGDAVALTKALATLAGSLTTAAQQDAAHRLITASESARFGGAALPDLSADIAVLEGIP